MNGSARVRSRGASPLPSMLIFLGCFIAARLVLREPELPAWLRMGAALLPVPAFIAVVVAFHRTIQRLDELQRLIQLRALAFAFPASWVVLLTLGLLELAVKLPPEDLGYRHVWALMPILYFVGLALARRKFAAEETE